jgi:predicted kinase
MTTVNRTVYIMRGIPGSGKSTVAERLVESYGYCGPGPAPVIHSTDDLCMVDGEYQFDIELAPARHEQNLQNFLGSLEKGVEAVIVDNTNVKTEQYAPYVEAAEAAGYAVVFVELAHPSLEVSVERNTHGVPVEAINQMILDWEPAQHCVTVDDVNDAADAMKVLQAREKFLVWFGFGVGSFVGSVVIAFAWFLWPAS